MTNAGYEIKATEIYDGDNTKPYFYGIAIGERFSENGSSYVTWEFKSDDIGLKNGNTFHCENYSFFWGHYFSDRNAALADYHQRLADGYGRHVKENADG